MRPVVLLVPALLFASLAGLASGAEDRYRLEKTQNGYVRMDTQTGEMSICEERSNQLICRAAAEERAASKDEIDRLQARLDAIEARVAKLEARPAVPEALLPSEQEFDKSMDYMEKFFHRFMGIMKDFGKDKVGPEAQPQKT
jgi:cell division protein FtsB